jgi:hypothetical protein
MKYKLIALVGLAVVFSAHTPAYADTYVKVDANGNAISSQIVCSADVCGDANSTFSKSTLGLGEQWVLQNTENHGVGAQDPYYKVKVDLETKVWTITSQDKVIDPISKEVISIQKTEQTYDRTLQKPIETKVTNSPIINTTTTVNNSTTINYYAKIMAEYQRWLDEINKWFYLTFGYKLGGNK